MKKRIFFVLGMHRSGTSYLTQTLNIMGFKLPNSIQSGALDNSKGHFESLNVSKFHDNILDSFNASWDSFIPPPKGWFSSEYAESSINELSKNFSTDFPGKGPMVLKDPRLSLFLPLWKEFVKKMDLESFYIIPLRHPMDVAASLHKRNNIGVNRSFLIWLNYLFRAEKDSRREKRSFIQFPQWSQDIEQSIDKIENDLGTKFPKKNKNNLIRARKEFDQNLVHYDSKNIENPRNDI